MGPSPGRIGAPGVTAVAAMNKRTRRRAPVTDGSLKAGIERFSRGPETPLMGRKFTPITGKPLDRLVQPLSVPSGIPEHVRVTLTVAEAIAPDSRADLHGVLPSEDARDSGRECENVDSRDDLADFP